MNFLWCTNGTMSLIGPRPERPEFDDLKSRDSHYRLRYQIRPGLSGWAQVNYHGTSLEDSSKFSYDLYYLRNSCFRGSFDTS